MVSPTRSSRRPAHFRAALAASVALSLVGAGMGVTFVPASVRETRPAGVVYRPLRDCPNDHVEIDVLWRRTDVTPVVEAFLRTAQTWSTPTRNQRVRAPVSLGVGGSGGCGG